MIEPHKHAAIILKWANDNAQIQYRNEGSTVWYDTRHPKWDEDCEYRVHPHSDLIRAYKKGASIESFAKGKWVPVDVPGWSPDIQYRIATDSAVVDAVDRWLWAYCRKSGIWTQTTEFYTEAEIAKFASESKEQREYIKLEWTRTHFPS